MVKHTENRLRGRIGVRSRLSVMSLPVPLRNALYEYLTPLLPEGSAHRYHQQDGPPPAYEKLYDTPRKQVSLADADAIEQASWATTRILTEAFAEEKREAPVAPDESDIPTPPVADTPVITPAPTPDPIPAPTLAPISEPMPTHEPVVAAPHESASASPLAVALGEDRATFLRYAMEGNTRGQREMAARLRKMADALADEINAITAETEIYDVVLEDDGRGGYTVAEDYRDMLIELLGGNL
jgi:hypothetical protein